MPKCGIPLEVDTQMNGISALNSNPQIGGTSITLISGGPDLSGLASSRLGGGLDPLAFNPQGSLLALQNQLMTRTLTQMMEMVMRLMGNGGSPASSSGSSSSASSSSPSTSSGGSGFGTSQGVGQAQPTETGKKLAEFAHAEATNGDSKGGLCYRDVSRALKKIGINVTGASAYMAAEQLAKNDKVTEVKVSKEDLPKLPAGAIVVWDKGNGHEHGHISISTGDGKEASDLMRTQITNYGTAFRVFMPK